MTTATKFAARPSTTQARATRRAAPQVETPQAAQFNDEPLFAIPSKARLLIATVAGLFAYAGSIYWSATAVGYLSIAAMLFTGSSFLGFVIAVMGWFFAIIGSLRIGWAVGKFVLTFEMDDITQLGASIKASAKSKTSLVRGWFTRGEAA
jgi:hypothetical protein